MTLGSASEEIKKSDELWSNSNFQELRKQQDRDFGYWGPYEFKMPETEGKWDNVTTNSTKILANKIIGLLSSSWLQLFIDVDDETRKKRKAISNTEQLANGCIWLADRELTKVPSGKGLQNALSFYAAIKGGTVKSVLFYEDGEGIKRDIRHYDPTFCQWLEGDGDLMWFCHRNYINKYLFEHLYSKQIKEGFTYSETEGRVLTYTVWDDEKWKVAVNNEYVDEGAHNLGYIPVNIRACGAAPYVQSIDYSDTMRWSWLSVFAGYRELVEKESKLLSILYSKGLESGKIKGVAKYDSSLSGGVLPNEIEKLGYSKGKRNEMVFLDSAKGQDFIQTVEPPSNQQVLDTYSIFRSMEILSSIDPIAFGQMARSGSGALAAELRAAALEFINPFRECVEQDFVWIAEECVKQFKNGGYDKLSLEGKDYRKNKFYADISAKDIEEKCFSCNLVPDKLRDEIQELGAAIQKVQYGLSSKKTAMLKHNIVEDPDSEIDNMDEEFASGDPVFRYDKLAKKFKDEGTPEGDRMAEYYMALSKITIQKTVQQAIMQQLMPEGEGKPPTVSPQMEAGRIASEAQQGIRESGI